MRSRQQLYKAFVLFFVLSLFIVILFRTPVGTFLKGIVEQVVAPVQRMLYGGIVGLSSQDETQTVAKLKEENFQLRKQLIDQKNRERDNQALRDQFVNSSVSPKQLLPAAIVGVRQTIFFIDKGIADGVREGSSVVYKNVLLGRIIQASTHRAVVATIQNKQLSFTGRTSKTGALGTIKGQENGIVFDNVVLSDKLEKNDSIETKGDMDEKGTGYPPGLLVGKITAIHKKASSLFQTAEVGELVDVERLRMVFVMIENQ